MNWQELFDRRFGAALLVIFGLLLAISPAGTRKPNQLMSQTLVTTISDKSDHVTAEDLAAWLIDKRPDILVVDIRSSEEYRQFHIAGAINIPLARLFEQESIDRLTSGQIPVLYSNGGTHAAQAWLLLKQIGVESYVLLGGLNYWAEAILNPNPPSDLVADEEILQYQFRQAAAKYFGGDSTATVSKPKVESSPAAKPMINLQKKKKKGDEGC